MKAKATFSRLIVIGTSLLFCGLFFYGCLESSFQLADQSRMPVWIHVPPGLTRNDVSLTMNYYSVVVGPEVTFVLKDKHGTVLQKVSGYQKRFSDDMISYPYYLVVEVNGVKEVIEHKKMEPIFYVSDDPSLKNAPVH